MDVSTLVQQLLLKAPRRKDVDRCAHRHVRNPGLLLLDCGLSIWQISCQKEIWLTFYNEVLPDFLANGFAHSAIKHFNRILI